MIYIKHMSTKSMQKGENWNASKINPERAFYNLQLET